MSEHQYTHIMTSAPDLSTLQELPKIETDRLIMRSLKDTDQDFASLRKIRTDEGAMKPTTDEPEETEERTKETLKQCSGPPFNNFFYGIFLKNADGTEGEMIGEAGIETMDGETGWPNFGRRFRSDYQSKGYGSESIRPILSAYASVPRTKTQKSVLSLTLRGGPSSDGSVPEQVGMWTKENNIRSIRTWRKLGARNHVNSFEISEIEDLVNLYGLTIDQISRWNEEK